MRKEYSKGDLTIVWQPDLCIHSAICFKNLPGVFKPRERPWVQMDGSDNENIRKAVALCPSGALSVKGNDPLPEIKDLRFMDKREVKIIPNGPVRVLGHCEITLADGTVVEKPNGVSFCRCGASSTKPFCDGTHKSNGYEG